MPLSKAARDLLDKPGPALQEPGLTTVTCLGQGEPVRQFAIGVVAGLASMVIELAGRVFLRIPTFPELIQDRLVLLTPGPVFAFILDRLLYLGKPTFFASLLLLQLVLAGLGGLLLARWPRPFALVAVLWLGTGLIALPLAGVGVFANRVSVALVTLLAFGAYALAYTLYSGVVAWPRLAWARGSAPPSERASNRRLLIGGSLSFLASLALGRWIIGTLPTLPPRAASTSGAAPAPGLPPEVTPTESFYVVSKNLADPEVDVESWHLRVEGLVEQPLDLRYDDVLALPAVTTDQTLMCISNEIGGDLISNGRWTGLRLADLLQKAGVQSGAQLVRFTSVDDYTETMPLQQALDPTTLLVYRLNDQPLPAKHGFPIRVLSTNTYGMKNPKWLTRVEVVASSPPGFWQRQGWNTDAIVQTMSEITAPDSGRPVPVGTSMVVGISFAGARGIRQVEISTDNGQSWASAQLLPPIGPLTWVFWQFPWSVDQPGLYTLVVRATDGSGALQASANTETFPNGATGYHHVTVRVTG